MYNIVFLGAPGAGKGTQAVVIAKELGMVHVATGDLFRKAIEDKTELGNQVKAYMDKGELVPNEITIKMVLGSISKVSAGSGVILDGFPRNIDQAIALDEALGAEKSEIKSVVYIKVPQDELVKRLSGRLVCRSCQSPYMAANVGNGAVCERCGGELYQREDDKPETVKNRLDVYFKKTAPLVDYYNKSGKLIEIDGVGEVNSVTGRIAEAVREGVIKSK